MNFFLSPGFGGACALLAALIAYAAASRSTAQRRKADEAALAEVSLRRADEAHALEVQQTWDRYVWMVDHADRIGVWLTAGLLSRITDTAQRLGDTDLVEFSRQFSVELLSAAQGEQIWSRPRSVAHTESEEEGGRHGSRAAD